MPYPLKIETIRGRVYALPPQNKSKNQIGGYKNMDAIKLLDSLEAGMPLVVTTTWQGFLTMRKVTIYAGTDGMGTYNFVDDNGPYRMTTEYIKEHCTISQELDGEDDLLKLTKIIKKVKSEEGVI
mgnify:CR=1 FL=1